MDNVIGKIVDEVVEESSSIFEKYAAHGGDTDSVRRDGHIIHATQIDLMRWQHANFDELDDRNFALGIAEESGEFSAARNGAQAVDAMGDTAIYLGQLLIANRLSLEPMLLNSFPVMPDPRAQSEAVGKLCHVVLKHRQGIRGMGDKSAYRLNLAHCAIGMCITHGLSATAYLSTAKVVLARKWR